MSQFEDNLWGSVIERHGDDLARADAAVATRARRTRPRLLAGATVGVAAAATAVTLLLSAASSPPAFAVTRLHDGSVSVRINRRSGIAGANRRLAAMGIHSRVMAVGDDQSIPPGCVVSAPGHPVPTSGVVSLVSQRPGQPKQVITLDLRDGTYTQPGGSGTGHLVACSAGNTGAGSAGTAGNTGPG